MYNMFLKRKDNKKGIALISVIIIVIILTIVLGIIIAVISSGKDIVLRNTIISRKNIEDDTKAYILATYFQVIAEEKPENIMDEVVDAIGKHNLNKTKEDRCEILKTNKVNNIITVKYKGIESEVTLPDDEEICLKFSSEDIKNKKYSVTFDYKDLNGINKRTIMYIDKSQTIQEYLNLSGENIPKNTEWLPNINFNDPIVCNKIYKEK